MHTDGAAKRLKVGLEVQSIKLLCMLKLSLNSRVTKNPTELVGVLAPTCDPSAPQATQ